MQTMTLLDFYKQLGSREARDAFARRCGTTLGYMIQLVYGYKRCGEDLAIAIERESRGKVRCEVLRPDVDWGYIRGTAKRRQQQAAGGASGRRQLT